MPSRTLTFLSSVTFAALTLGCASPRPASFPSDLALEGSDGKTHDLSSALGDAKLSVFVFFAEDCPCMAAHEPRLKAWAEQFESQRVRFYLVDAEAGASEARSARWAKERAYHFPVLADPGGVLAQAFGVEYATHTVVVDSAGRIRYSGALDSDKVVLHEDAELYLEETLHRLLSGQSPKRARTEPMGCVIER